jgi:hypothetical protein
MADEPEPQGEPKSEPELVPVYGPDIITYAGDDPAAEATFRQGPLLGFEPAPPPPEPPPLQE